MTRKKASFGMPDYMLAMHTLIKTALAAYNSAPQSVRVSPSVPVLYFGDYQSYRKSHLRIITVGLNPSLNEFPITKPFNPFRRFGAAATSPTSVSSMEMALNNYFVNDPYKKWFSCFEPLLSGFGASFYPGRRQNTALHTDLLSPVATNPTWSALNKNDQASLELAGVPLWHQLIDELQPHLALISVAARHLSKISFPSKNDWQPVFSIPRKKPYEVKHSARQLSSGFVTDFVFGQAAQLPFGSLSMQAKESIGTKLFGKLTNW